MSLGNLILKWRGSVVAWKLRDPITHWRSLLPCPEKINPQQSTSLQDGKYSIQVEISSISREELRCASRNIFLPRSWRPALVYSSMKLRACRLSCTGSTAYRLPAEAGFLSGKGLLQMSCCDRKLKKRSVEYVWCSAPQDALKFRNVCHS